MTTIANTPTQTDEERLRAVLQYIRQNLAEPLEREQLAMMAGFSVPHFHRIFTASIGISPAAYIRQIRLKRAGFKLRMGAVDICEVALAAGYETHTAFSKAFKQQFGLSPSEFRQLDCRTATAILHKGEIQ